MVNIYTVLASGVAYSKLNTEVLKKKKKKKNRKKGTCMCVYYPSQFLPSHAAWGYPSTR